MKKLFIFIVLTLFTVNTINVQAGDNKVGGSTSGGEIVKTGTMGGQFLKIDVGARGSAMGAYGSVANDLSAMYWNAAGLADVSSMSAEFTYTSWFANMDFNNIGFALPVGDGYTVGASFTSLGVDGIPVTTVAKPEGTGATYSIKDIAASLTFAGYLTKQFSFGITTKFIFNEISNTQATGMAFDIGTMYDTEIYGIKLGFSIHNLGLDGQYSGQDLSTMNKMNDAFSQSPVDAEFLSYPFSLPLSFRASVSSEVINTKEHYLVVVADFVTQSDSKDQYIFGAEYVWNELVAFRGGYRFGHDQLSATGGVGFKYYSGGFGGRMDYSITPSTSIGFINRLSVALDFGA